VGSDNFLNSLRYCFVRDTSAAKETGSNAKDLPQSLLKSLDELLSDYVDITLPSNSDIVSKCVNILKIMGEFIASEKKKQESSFLIEEAKREEGNSPRSVVGSPRAAAVVN